MRLGKRKERGPGSRGSCDIIQGGGIVAATAEAKPAAAMEMPAADAAKPREGVAADINADRPFPVSTQTMSEVAAPEWLTRLPRGHSHRAAPPSLVRARNGLLCRHVSVNGPASRDAGKLQRNLEGASSVPSCSPEGDASGLMSSHR